MGGVTSLKVQYSKFDGFSSVEGLVGRAKEFGMKAVGITDHGTVAGIIAFLQECRKQDVRPILGMEAYMSRDHTCRGKEKQPEGRKGNRHMNVIAKNLEGYKNLCRLSHTGCLEGYYYDPRIDWELLSAHKEGLIVTSACLSNIINYKLSVDKFDEAKVIAGMFVDLFGDDFYLEMMYHGIDREGKILPEIQRLSKAVGAKILATNDCHYIKREDAEFQQVLMCMSTGRSIRDPKRLSFPYDEFYFKSQAEMYGLFKTTPEYLTNTLEVAEKCDYSDIIFGAMHLPKFELPEGETSPFKYLTKLAQQGCRKLGWDKSPEHVARLKRELDDIQLIWDTKRYDFSTYFLVVEDMTRKARSKGIASGVRGSGYGAVLLHCLGLCRGPDPLDQHLMWERFLGFDDKYFIGESDVGIGVGSQVAEEKEEIDLSDPTDIMADRYI